MSDSVRGVETTKSPVTVELSRVRQLWHLLEPLHAVLYYAPEAFEEAAALGYGTEERWRATSLCAPPRWARSAVSA